jgi:hypothetical protein
MMRACILNGEAHPSCPFHNLIVHQADRPPSDAETLSTHFRTMLGTRIGRVNFGFGDIAVRTYLVAEHEDRSEATGIAGRLFQVGRTVFIHRFVQ